LTGLGEICYNYRERSRERSRTTLTSPTKVTIEDVARAAGVSRQTISRAINNRGEISPETRHRVLNIAEEMGYRPSGIARGLATRHTRTLGLVVPDNANPFFSEVARGAEDVAYSEGYRVFLCNTNEEQERELAVLQSLEENRVDGVVLCSSRLYINQLHTIVARFPASVLINRRLEDDEVGMVLIDDELGGQTATQYLIQIGHKAIGFLAGPPTSYSGKLRAKGYRNALIAAGLPDNANWIHHCFPTVEGGQQAAHELLLAQPDLTALFCFNDLVAVGVLHACADLNLIVPNDIAVVGFDDITLAGLVTPALTTCHVPRYDLGAQAMHLLLSRIQGCSSEGCKEIILRPELVIRSSTLQM
jgi:LacI family transcriptional regulator, galactose operon repressor